MSSVMSSPSSQERGQEIIVNDVEHSYTRKVVHTQKFILLDAFTRKYGCTPLSKGLRTTKLAVEGEIKEGVLMSNEMFLSLDQIDDDNDNDDGHDNDDGPDDDNDDGFRPGASEDSQQRANNASQEVVVEDRFAPESPVGRDMDTDAAHVVKRKHSQVSEDDDAVELIDDTEPTEPTEPLYKLPVLQRTPNFQECILCTHTTQDRSSNNSSSSSSSSNTTCVRNWYIL